jgi:DNA repair exonuclease SbcCD ATPase subunit
MSTESFHKELRLESLLDNAKERYSEASNKRKRDKEALRLERAGIARNEAKKATLKATLEVIQGAAAKIQYSAHKQISQTVTYCLRYVFNEPYDFQIKFTKKYNKTSAELVFVRDGEEISPMDASGGGVIDVASFALRLSSILLARPQLSRTVILDEPFKFVSSDYLPRVRDLLEELAEKHKFQFIIVTHLKELETGNVISL